MAFPKRQNRQAGKRLAVRNSRRSSRSGTLAGNLLLESVALLILLTVVLALRQPSANYSSEFTANNSNQLAVDLGGEFESYLSGLFRDTFEIDELFSAGER